MRPKADSKMEHAEIFRLSAKRIHLFTCIVIALWVTKGADNVELMVSKSHIHLQNCKNQRSQMLMLSDIRTTLLKSIKSKMLMLIRLDKSLYLAKW